MILLFFIFQNIKINDKNKKLTDKVVCFFIVGNYFTIIFLINFKIQTSFTWI